MRTCPYGAILSRKEVRDIEHFLKRHFIVRYRDKACEHGRNVILGKLKQVQQTYDWKHRRVKD